VSGVPILVEASGLRVLVVGGGAVAARKAKTFCEAGANVRVVSPAAADDVLELAAAGKLALVSRPFLPGDVGDAELVIAATSDRDTNAAVAEEARAVRCLVNVADEPGEGNFVTMATHRSGELVIGVSAGGVPNAATRIRDEIGSRFDDRYAHALAELAAMRQRLLDRHERHRWRELADAVIGDDFCATVESEQFDARVGPWR
jgi:precorrin-2 dehydrogenase/sirohydrochlorin ferrochelatase